MFACDALFESKGRRVPALELLLRDFASFPVTLLALLVKREMEERREGFEASGPCSILDRALFSRSDLLSLQRRVRDSSSTHSSQPELNPNPQHFLLPANADEMPRDTSNSATKARNSKHAAATGLKTGNLKTKGTLNRLPEHSQSS